MTAPIIMDLFVANVEKEGSFLKIWAQKDHSAAAQIERLLLQHYEQFEAGVGMPSPEQLQVDLLCCARYGDGAYYRARVLDVNMNTGTVLCSYIDYGDKQHVPFANLRLLDNLNRIFRYPAQATSYILNGVVGSWETPVVHELAKNIAYETVKGTVVNNVGTRQEIHLLTLFIDGRDFAETLVERQFAIRFPQESFEVLVWNELAIPRASNPPFMRPHMFGAYPNMPVAPAAMAPVRPLPPGSVPSLNPVAPVSMHPVRPVAPLPMPQVRPIAPNAMPHAKSVPSVMNHVKPVMPLNNERVAMDMRKKSDVGAMSRFSTIILEDNADHEVYISHVERGSLAFAVQLVAHEEQLEKMSAALNNPTLSFTALKQPYIPGTICLAKFSEDDNIYRAVITDVGSDQCQVYFVDFGNSDHVKCQNLFEIPAEFTYPKVMAVQFSLVGAEKNCSDEMLEIFHDLALDKKAILRVVPSNGRELSAKQLGELFIDDCNVRELINVEILKKKPKTSFMNVHFPEAGSKVKVVVCYVGGLDNFYVQLACHQKDLESLMADVDRHCGGPGKNMLESEIQPGAVCCAKFPGDGQWYRAIVINADLNDLEVMYVDFGNEEKVSLDCLKSVDELIVNKLRAQAIPCRLSGFEKDDQSLVARFEELVLENQFTMHVVQLNKDVSVPCLVVQLFDETGNDISKMLVGAVPPVLQESVPVPAKSASNAIDQSAAMIVENSTCSKKWDKPVNSVRNSDYRQKQAKPSSYDKDCNDQISYEPPTNHKADPAVWGVGRERTRKPMVGHCDRNAVSYNGQEGSGGSRSSETSRASQFSCASAQAHKTWDTPRALSIAKTSVDVGSTSGVTVTFIKSPTDFYIIQKPDAEFDSLQDKIADQFSLGGETLPSSSKTVGSVCVAKYSADGYYYRARILNVSNTGAEVFFLDYGNTETVDNSDLLKMESDIAAPRAKAIHCQLIGVFNNGWSDDLIAGLDPLLECETLEADFLEENDDFYSIILRNTQNNQIINELFGATKETMVSPTGIVSSVKEHVQLDGTVHGVNVCWFETPERFYVHLTSFEKEFKETMAQIQKEYQRKTPLDYPAIGQAVVARYPGDNCLYRGVVKVQRGDKFGVQFIDYGNKALVEPSEIYGLEKRFSSLPAQAILCKLAGVSPMNGKWDKNSALNQYFDGTFTCAFPAGGAITPYVVHLSQNGEDLSECLIHGGLVKPDINDKIMDPSGPMVAESSAPLVANSSAPIADGNPSASIVTVASEAPTDSAAPPVDAPLHEVPSVIEIPGVDPQILVGQMLPIFIECVEESRISFTFSSADREQIDKDVSHHASVEGLVHLPSHQLSLGQHCLVQDEPQRYKRAVILDLKATTGVCVKFMDYTGTSEIPSDKVYYLPDSLESAPALIQQCDITNIMSKDLKSLEQQEGVLFILSYDNDRYQGQLLDKFGQAFSFSSASSVKTCPLMPMPVVTRRMAVDVSHACGSEVWVQRSKTVQTIVKLCDDMYDLYEDGGTFLSSTAPGSLSAAKSLVDGNWYRSVIVGPVGESFEVHYLDYGNNEVLPINHLKKLEHFLDVPAYALKANLPITTDDHTLGTTILDMTVDKSLLGVFVREGESWLVELLDGKEILSLQLIRTGRALSIGNSPFPNLLREPDISLKAGKSYSAVLSFAKSCSEFFIHLSADLDKLNKMQHDINTLAHCVKPMEEFPAPGQRVMAQYVEDEVWYRGEVLANQSIHFIDYGNDEVVDLTHLKLLPPALEEVKSLAVKCSLVAPSNMQWSEGALTPFLDHIEGEDPFSFTVVSTGDPNIINIKSSKGLCVSDALAEAGLLEDASVNSEAVPFQANVVFSNSPSDFYIHAQKDFGVIEEIASELDKADDFNNTDGCEGSICAALFSEDDTWYRAKVLSIKDDEFEVQFLDYGNCSVTKAIKALPDHLKKLPPVAKHCSLPVPVGMTAWPQSTHQKFEELTSTDDPIEVKVLKSGEPVEVNLTLSGRDISDELKSMVELEANTGKLASFTSSVEQEASMKGITEPVGSTYETLSEGSGNPEQLKSSPETLAIYVAEPSEDFTSDKVAHGTSEPHTLNSPQPAPDICPTNEPGQEELPNSCTPEFAPICEPIINQPVSSCMNEQQEVSTEETNSSLLHAHEESERPEEDTEPALNSACGGSTSELEKIPDSSTQFVLTCEPSDNSIVELPSPEIDASIVSVDSHDDSVVVIDNVIAVPVITLCDSPDKVAEEIEVDCCSTSLSARMKSNLESHDSELPEKFILGETQQSLKVTFASDSDSQRLQQLEAPQLPDLCREITEVLRLEETTSVPLPENINVDSRNESQTHEESCIKHSEETFPSQDSDLLADSTHRNEGVTVSGNRDSEAISSSSDVIVTLSTYPDLRSSELDSNEIFYGQSLAKASDFESELKFGIPGTRTYSFDDCEVHALTVEIGTSPSVDRN